MLAIPVLAVAAPFFDDDEEEEDDEPEAEPLEVAVADAFDEPEAESVEADDVALSENDFDTDLPAHTYLSPWKSPAE